MQLQKSSYSICLTRYYDITYKNEGPICIASFSFRLMSDEQSVNYKRKCISMKRNQCLHFYLHQTIIIKSYVNIVCNKDHIISRKLHDKNLCKLQRADNCSFCLFLEELLILVSSLRILLVNNSIIIAFIIFSYKIVVKHFLWFISITN